MALVATTHLSDDDGLVLRWLGTTRAYVPGTKDGPQLQPGPSSNEGRWPMDRKTLELIALGASAAANCRPCMEYHLAAGKKLGVPDEQLQGALEVGVRVNRGAARKTVDYIKEDLGQSMSVAPAESCCG